MKRIFRVNGQRKLNGFCTLALMLSMIPLLVYDETQHLDAKSVIGILLNVAAIGIGVWVCLEFLVVRVVADDARIQIFDAFNRKTADLTYEEITSYTKETGTGWTVKQGEKVVRMPKVDRPQFHAVIAEKAPKALKAKLWKCGQLPPVKDFTALSPFDWNGWLTNVLGAGVVSLFISVFSKLFAVVYFVSSVLQVSYTMKDLLAKLDITAEGVSVRWPWEKRAIQWDEISAIFCEKGVDRHSYFVVTAPHRSITVPAHVLADPEVRRKFFYSIPDHTRCVNFEEIRFRRRGRGKRIKAGEESFGTLEPISSFPA